MSLCVSVCISMLVSEIKIILFMIKSQNSYVYTVNAGHRIQSSYNLHSTNKGKRNSCWTVCFS